MVDATRWNRFTLYPRVHKVRISLCGPPSEDYFPIKGLTRHNLLLGG